MSKKKIEEKQAEAAMAASEEAPQGAQQDEAAELIEKKLAELESKQKQIQKEAEEAALKRMCAASGISYDQVIAKEQAEKDDPESEVDLGSSVVRVNGRRYSGAVRGKRSFVECLAAMAGSRKMRLLNEAIGNKGVVELLSEGIRTRVVGQFSEDELGKVE